MERINEFELKVKKLFLIFDKLFFLPKTGNGLEKIEIEELLPSIEYVRCIFGKEKRFIIYEDLVLIIEVEYSGVNNVKELLCSVLTVEELFCGDKSYEVVDVLQLNFDKLNEIHNLVIKSSLSNLQKNNLTLTNLTEWSYDGYVNNLGCLDDWNEEIINNTIKEISQKPSIDFDERLLNMNLPFPSYPEKKSKLENSQISFSTSDRPFVCTYFDCNRAFKRLEHLKRHHRIHTGERPFKCHVKGCYKSFARSDNLAQHLKVHSTNVTYEYDNGLDASFFMNSNPGYHHKKHQ